MRLSCLSAEPEQPLIPAPSRTEHQTALAVKLAVEHPTGVLEAPFVCATRLPLIARNRGMASCRRLPGIFIIELYKPYHRLIPSIYFPSGLTSALLLLNYVRLGRAIMINADSFCSTLLLNLRNMRRRSYVNSATNNTAWWVLRLTTTIRRHSFLSTHPAWANNFIGQTQGGLSHRLTCPISIPHRAHFSLGLSKPPGRGRGHHRNSPRISARSPCAKRLPPSSYPFPTHPRKCARGSPVIDYVAENN